MMLGAALQTWNCPLGGQAHVMIVPKQTYRNQGNPSFQSNNVDDGQLSKHDQRDAA